MLDRDALGDLVRADGRLRAHLASRPARALRARAHELLAAEGVAATRIAELLDEVSDTADPKDAAVELVLEAELRALFDAVDTRADDRIDLDELCAALGERDEDDPQPPGPALEGRELAAAVRRELLEDRRLDQRAAVVRLGEDDETVDPASWRATRNRSRARRIARSYPDHPAAPKWQKWKTTSRAARERGGEIHGMAYLAERAEKASAAKGAEATTAWVNPARRPGARPDPVLASTQRLGDKKPRDLGTGLKEHRGQGAWRGWASPAWLVQRAAEPCEQAPMLRGRRPPPLLGTGTEESQGGARYKGGMRKGRRHGKGTMRWADGRRYVGEWKEGHRDGRGRLTKNGQLLYDGAWRDGSPSGNGKMISKEGEYRGSFAAGQRHGQGKLTTPDGGVSYRGGWRLGRCDGRGTLSFASGVKLKGEWRGGRLVGDAALSRPSVPGEGVQTDARLPLALQAGSTVREAKGQAAQQCGGRDASRFRVRDDSTGEELDDKMTMRQAKLQDDDCLQVLAKVPFLDLPQGELSPEEQAAMRERLADIEASRGKLEKKRQEAELRGGKLTCSCPLCDEEMSALDHTEAELRRRLGGWGLGAWTGALDPDRMDVADLRVMVPHEQHDSEGKPFVIDLPHPLSPEQRSAVTRWLGNGRSDMLHPPHRGDFSGRLHLIDTNAKPDMFGVVKDRLEIVCGRLAAAEEGRPIVLEGLRETKTTAQLAERLAAAEVRTLPPIATATTKDSWPANSERGKSAAS